MGSDNDDIMAEDAMIRRRIKEAMRHYRAANGLSQGGMARRLGISKRNYQKYEGEDIRGVPMPVLVRFALEANIDLNGLLIGPRSRRRYKQTG